MKVNDLAATLAQTLRTGNIHVGSGTGEGLTPVMKLAEWDVDSVRSHFVFPTTGCHCAPLAHHALGIEASCRFSFYLYNTFDEVDRAVDALADIVSFGSDASKQHLELEGTGKASIARPLQPDPRGSLS